jgi:hypothetical protein
VQSYDSGNELRRNRFEISAELSHCHRVTAQIIFVNAFERAQVVSDILPHAFYSVCVNFPNVIAIIVTSPFIICMTNSGMFSDDVIIGLPLIGIAGCAFF